MIVTTTPAIEGKRITRYCGVVAGEAILGAGNGMLMVSASGTAVVAE
jgi:uncharacterized protein YbjQ (UPF0145 family)